MKIGITINADYGKELYLHENSEKLKSELLGVVEQFIGKDTCINYEQEGAQIDVMTGEVVNYNPYLLRRQFNYEYDMENMPLKREIPVVVMQDK